jgi:hypothetical protein
MCPKIDPDNAQDTQSKTYKGEAAYNARVMERNTGAVAELLRDAHVLFHDELDALRKRCEEMEAEQANRDPKNDAYYCIRRDYHLARAIYFAQNHGMDMSHEIANDLAVALGAASSLGDVDGARSIEAKLRGFIYVPQDFLPERG